MPRKLRAFPLRIAQGSTGSAVKLLQEWMNESMVVIDPSNEFDQTPLVTDGVYRKKGKLSIWIKRLQKFLGFLDSHIDGDFEQGLPEAIEEHPEFAELYKNNLAWYPWEVEMQKGDITHFYCSLFDGANVWDEQEASSMEAYLPE